MQHAIHHMWHQWPICQPRTDVIRPRMRKWPPHTKGAPPFRERPLKRPSRAGGALPSRGVAPAVLSALAGLAFGFGMVPGVPPPPRPPAREGRSSWTWCVCPRVPLRAPWGPHSDRGRDSLVSAGRPRARGLGRLVRLG